MWTLKQFEKVYDRYQSSGLRVKEFCRNECVQESKFYYWQRRLREHNHHEEQSSGFVPIVFSGSTPPLPTKNRVQQKLIPEHVDPAADNVLEIVYPNGVKMRVPMEANLAQIRSLILLAQ